MAGLIEKSKRNNLKRIEIPIPKNTISRNDFLKSSYSTKSKESTTIRCSCDTADKLNSLTVLFDLESVDVLLKELLDKEIDTFNIEKFKEFKNIENVYIKKRTLKKRKSKK